MGIKKFLLNQLVSRLRIKGALRFLYALEKVGHPSEVAFPMELLPSGVKMHLRGFMNFHTVQINLDWVWPYWIEQQFNPASKSFIPRAMNLTHVNQTHRNWTAVGVIGSKVEPIVDPRGLLTPWFDGWSLDFWLYKDGSLIAPSQQKSVKQWLGESLPLVNTAFTKDGLSIQMEVWGEEIHGHDAVIQKVRVENCDEKAIEGRAYFSIRPYNPEGMSLIRQFRYHEQGAWEINRKLAVVFPKRPDRVSCSDQRIGDVSILLPEMPDCRSLKCDAGMGTALSEYVFSLAPGESEEYTALCTINREKSSPLLIEDFKKADTRRLREKSIKKWREVLSKGMAVSLPDSKIEACFQANHAFLHLFDDGDEITPGPLTYHRFWFRDAAFLINALDKLGYEESSEQKLATYPGRQKKDGFFISQNGEWDANGEAIWTLMEHYRLYRNEDFLRRVYPSIRKGVFWIERKRKKTRNKKGPEKGLLPAGLSAEHLGPNDYFYWDDFWSLAGIRDAIEAARTLGKNKDAGVFEKIYHNFWEDLRRSLSMVETRLGRKVLPASPYRRMDAGAVGSISALYPLRLFEAENEWIVNTVDYLRKESFFEDGFFQNMIHSGVNPYLTAQIAQCYLLRRNREAWPLIYYLLKVATPTFTWPEAIHPLTGGGCMGDGHHGWAAAELLLLVRNILFFEEEDRIVLTPILPQEWTWEGAVIQVDRAPTYFGPLGFRIEFGADDASLHLWPRFRTHPSGIEWNVPFDVQQAKGDGAPLRVLKNRIFFPSKTRRVWLKKQKAKEVQ